MSVRYPVPEIDFHVQCVFTLSRKACDHGLAFDGTTRTVLPPRDVADAHYAIARIRALTAGGPQPYVGQDTHNIRQQAESLALLVGNPANEVIPHQTYYFRYHPASKVAILGVHARQVDADALEIGLPMIPSLS